MKIDTLKDLQKVIQLCRKLGVASISVGDISLQLGSVPRTGIHAPNLGTLPDYSSDIPEANIQIPKFTGDIEAPDIVKTEELTEEQLMFYSSASTSNVSEQQ